MFKTWKFAGVTYLSFPMGDGFGIVDEQGGWYGAWQDVDNFRKRVTSEATRDGFKLSQAARLSVHTS
jgi:hypothetical protein